MLPKKMVGLKVMILKIIIDTSDGSLLLGENSIKNIRKFCLGAIK